MPGAYLSLLVGAGCFSAPVFGQTALEEPEERIFQYHSTNDLADPVANLARRVADGSIKLNFETGRGYLPALLSALRVPASSQSLVFSKTSSQRERINPQTPRAVYFADDISVGWVPGGSVIELASVDPSRGPIFYTLDQSPVGTPKFTRRADCFQCHLAPRTLNVPGLLVRSVYTASNGVPLGQVDGFINGHNSPLKVRWGGWYVTGSHSGEPDLGNIFATDPDHPEQLDRPTPAAAAVTGLQDRFDTTRYLSPHSDLVALLVLEHQVRMQNLITRANYETRSALDQQAKESANVSNWPQERIAHAGEMLLEYMLFRNEAPLSGPVRGTSAFAEEFQRGGPEASKGRSLRQLDLQTRLMRYPCSFLIYSAAFDGLPREMKNYLWRRLEQILTGQDRSATYATMAARDRQEVLEILLETKPEFAAWMRINNPGEELSSK